MPILFLYEISFQTGLLVEFEAQLKEEAELNERIIANLEKIKLQDV